MIASIALTEKELLALESIKAQFTGLTLQQSYNVISAAKGFLEVIGDNADDIDNFIFH